MAELFFLLFLIYLLAGFRKISPAHYGIIYFFNRFIGVRKEGLIWAPLWICSVKEYDTSPEPLDLVVTVFTKEEDSLDSSLGVTLSVKGSVRPDLRFMKRYRLWFGKVGNDLEAKIEAVLQEIAGEYKLIDFMRYHRAIELLLNCATRLSNSFIPHFNGRTYNEVNNVIPARDVLAFYERHAQAIQALLDNEHKSLDYSDAEEYYGVDIGRLHLSAPRLSEETRKALAARREAEAQLQEIGLRAATAEELVLRFKGELSPKDALAEVAHVRGADRMIYTLQGAGNDVGLWVTDERKGGRRGRGK